MPKKFLNLKNARQPKQKAKMKEIIKAGICPFCPKHLEKYHDTPILKKGKHWIVTFNDYPYPKTKHHFLFINHKHLTNVSQLKKEASAELINLLTWLLKKYKLHSGVLLLRFGETKQTGATVEHLHGHLIIGQNKKQSFYLTSDNSK